MLTSPIQLFSALVLLFPFVGQDEVTTIPHEYEGWVDLIGDDLDTHWRQVNCAESTFRLVDDPKAEGKQMISCTGKPTGVLRTVGVYENFVVEFEWRHMTKGWGANAGFFLWSDPLPALGVPFTRSIELQVANFDGNGDWYTRHGDIFPIHGARMWPDPRFGRHQGGARSMPLEFRAHGTAEWNHYRIVCVDGTVQLEVNGRLVSAGYQASPRRGHLCLESEGGEVHFRALRVLPLPPDPRGLEEADMAQLADEAEIVRPLYDGLGFEGWSAEPADAWAAADWMLKGRAPGTIAHALPDGDLELRLDWRVAKAKPGEPQIAPSRFLPVSIGDERWSGNPRAAGEWNRLELARAGGAWRVVLNGEALDAAAARGGAPSSVLTLHVVGAPVDFASILLLTPRDSGG